MDSPYLGANLDLGHSHHVLVLEFLNQRRNYVLLVILAEPCSSCHRRLLTFLRLDDFPGLPGYALTNWFGLLAPAATPKQVLAQLNGDVLRILKQEDLQKKIADLGADVVGNSAEEFGAAMRAESAQWAEVIKAAGIRVEE